CIAVEIAPARIEKRMALGYCDVVAKSSRVALALAQASAARGEPLGIALIGNGAEAYGEMLERWLEPTAVTDQTSAHDPLNGYIPIGYSLAEAVELRAREPERYVASSLASIARQLRSMLDFKAKGAIVFEYGNNIRGAAQEAGESRAF